VLLGSPSIKTARKMLVKLISRVNFTKIFEHLLHQYYFPKKLQSEKSYTKILSYKKALHKMLIKLTQGVNVTNILQAAFAMIIFHQIIQSQTVSREKLHKKLMYKNCLKNVDEIDTREHLR